MFYFREEELQRLARFCQQPDTKAMAVYGRRRAGKTRLLTEFMEQHRGSLAFLYFQCTSYDYGTCLSDFQSIAGEMFPEERLIRNAASFRDIIDYLTRICSDPLCIIIDEFPFLAKRKEDVIAEFQWIIDHGLHGQRLILTGSNRSFMAHQIQQYESPLYGRFDEIIEVKPFTFQQIRVLFPNPDDAMQVFSMTGGVAQYVRFFQQYPSVSEAASSLFFRPDGRLFQEASNMLMQELRDTTTYERILRALGSRSKTAAQIASLAGLDSKGIFTYLNRLAELDVIAPVLNPLTREKRNQRYRIKDLLFRFHYTFIEPHVSMINAIREQSMQHILTDRYQEYLGIVYEDIIRENCFQYALDGRLPFLPETVGSWWGNIQENGNWKESEIDVVALDHHHLLLGECKYRSKRIGMNEYLYLQTKSAFVPAQDREIYYLLASRSGFTDEMKNYKDPHLILIDLM